MNPSKVPTKAGRVDIKYRVSRRFHKQLLDAAKRERRTIQAYVDLAVTERMSRKAEQQAVSA